MSWSETMVMSHAKVHLNNAAVAIHSGSDEIIDL